MIGLVAKPINWDTAIRGQAQAAQDKVVLILEKVGEVMVTYLEGLTEEQRGWVSRHGTAMGSLAGSYGSEVTPIPGGARLGIKNDAEHAAYVEAIDGMMVVHGIMDPGGPVEQKLVEVCAEFAPEWTVVRR